MFKNKKGMSTAMFVMSFLIVLIILTVAVVLLNKTSRVGNNVILDQACKLQDYDGDGYSNFVELSGINVDRPCPCDNIKDANSYGYKIRLSTFNYSKNKNNGPYLLFNKDSADYFEHRQWISEADKKELELKLRSLFVGPRSTYYSKSMILSDDLSQYLKKDADLKHPPAQFFCPQSCKNEKKDDYKNCCDVETFRKEWFAKGTSSDGLIGECRTPLNICKVEMAEKCAKEDKKK